MMAGLPADDISGLGPEHQAACLDTLGADLLGSAGGDFSAIEPAETVFDKLEASPEAAAVEASAAAAELEAEASALAEQQAAAEAAGNTAEAEELAEQQAEASAAAEAAASQVEALESQVEAAATIAPQEDAFSAFSGDLFGSGGFN